MYIYTHTETPGNMYIAGNNICVYMYISEKLIICIFLVADQINFKTSILLIHSVLQWTIVQSDLNFCSHQNPSKSASFVLLKNLSLTPSVIDFFSFTQHVWYADVSKTWGHTLFHLPPWFTQLSDIVEDKCWSLVYIPSWKTWPECLFWGFWKPASEITTQTQYKRSDRIWGNVTALCWSGYLVSSKVSLFVFIFFYFKRELYFWASHNSTSMNVTILSRKHELP